jgi:hypothetical protein
VSIFSKAWLFALSTTVTLTSILSRPPAGVTRLLESYGEQVRRAGQGRGSPYHIKEILNLKPGREITNPKHQIRKNIKAQNSKSQSITNEKFVL